MRRLVSFVLLLPLLASCGGADVHRREAAVTAAEASTVLRQVANLAAERTPDAASRLCTTLSDGCHGLSSGFLAGPASAPRSHPSVLCDIPLPPTAGQAGARVLVVTGRDATDRTYLGQVLVQRRQGRPIVHEPAFWLGIRYTQVVHGMAWSGASDDPRSRAAHDAAVRGACADPAAFIAAVTLRPEQSP